MIEFGNTLRQAREAKGYTVAQIAEITHLAPSTVTELEEENFSRIAAPIYGRGFVKLYCGAVGLDPQPLISEFMDIYEGNRDIGIRERPAATAAPEPPAVPAPVPPVAATPVAAVPPVMATPRPEPEVQPSLFAPPPPAAEPLASEPPAPMEGLPLPEADEPRLSRYQTPMRMPSAPKLSPAVWRVGLLALVGLALLIAMVMGIRALYRATGPQAKAVEAPLLPAMPKTPTAPKAAGPRAPRTPMAVPNLYVD